MLARSRLTQPLRPGFAARPAPPLPPARAAIGWAGQRAGPPGVGTLGAWCDSVPTCPREGRPSLNGTDYEELGVRGQCWGGVRRLPGDQHQLITSNSYARLGSQKEAYREPQLDFQCNSVPPLVLGENLREHWELSCLGIPAYSTAKVGQPGGTPSPQADVFPPGLRVVPAEFEKNQSGMAFPQSLCPKLRRQRDGLGGSAETECILLSPCPVFPSQRVFSPFKPVLKPTEMSYLQKICLNKNEKSRGKRVETTFASPLSGLLSSFKRRIDYLTSREVSKVLLLSCKKSTSKISGLIMFNVRI